MLRHTATDCDGNGLFDPEEAQEQPWLDWNGDWQLDSCVSANYCSGEVNSSGGAGTIGVAGTPVLVQNDMTLRGMGLPPGQFAVFLMSAEPDFVPNFSGSQGNLCLGGTIVRLLPLTMTKPDGTTLLDLPPALPPPNTLTAGDRRYFQLWFRDVGGTSNTTDGIEVLFR